MLGYALAILFVAYVLLRLLASERQQARESMYRKFVADAPALARQRREQVANELIRRR